MTLTSWCTSLTLLVVLSLLGHGEALFGRAKGRGGGGGGGGGGAVVTGNTKVAAAAAAKIDPQALQVAASQASERVMMWGTTTIFQLKTAVQLKGQVERLQTAASQLGGKTMLRMDPAMYKEIVGGALGGVFLMLNSPNMGKVSDLAKTVMKDERRQVRVVDLDKKVQESFSAGKGKVNKGPKGFLEGALLNKEVAAAHDRFMADIEALSSSALAKKVGASAEAYHDALLVYATNEPAATK
eukprot:g10540.t1